MKLHKKHLYAFWLYTLSLLWTYVYCNPPWLPTLQQMRLIVWLCLNSKNQYLMIHIWCWAHGMILCTSASGLISHVADDPKESWPCTYKAINCKDPYGSISPYIGNLTFLRFINLQNNSFYGEIPHEVGHLFRLQTLNLNNNTLEGEIPSSLSNCSNARFINLLWNRLNGKIPVGLGSLL